MLELAAIALWLLLLGITSAVFAQLYAGFDRLLCTAHAEVRSLARLLYASAPPLISSLAVVVTLFPDAVAHLLPSHCHGASCSAHLPVIAEQPVRLMVVASGAVVLLALTLASLLLALRATRNRLRALWRLSRDSGSAQYQVLPSAQLWACCAGLLRHRILLTSAAVDTLSDGELAAVLAHEQAHALRFDNLRSLWLQLSTGLWPRAARRAILRAAASDAEAACDLRSARQLGGCEAVVAALQRMTGAGLSLQQNRAQAFAANDTRWREQQLLTAYPEAAATLASRVFIAAGALGSCALLGLALSLPAHYLLELVGS